jgi:hypothetical protein
MGGVNPSLTFVKKCAVEMAAKISLLAPNVQPVCAVPSFSNSAAFSHGSTLVLFVVAMLITVVFSLQF